jgi:N-acetylneuraminic acid mutarotase
MIVWGGDTTTGGRYDPRSDTWTPMSTTAAPVPRDGYVMSWSGNEALVWGGRSHESSFPMMNTGGRYDPLRDSWRSTSTAGAPTGTYWASGVWAGSQWIVWGGRTCDYVTGCEVNSGGRYDPLADAWRAVTTTGAPSARHDHIGVWTGARMLIWGGGGTPSNTGGLYDPATDTWSPTTTTRAPTPRRRFGGVWTGDRLVVWGGLYGLSAELDDGGVYCPPRT